MRILFLGEIGKGQTSLMRMRALGRLGHEVRGIHTVDPWSRVSWPKRQIERRLGFGSVVDAINRSVLADARDFRPDMVWAEKQEYLRVDTLEEMRRLGSRLVHFSPDPYFTLRWKRTSLMDEAIRAFDVLVCCKSYERTHYESIGKPVVYMPLGYCDEVHRPVRSDAGDRCAVGFVGGWEPRRERLLRTIAVSGADLKFRGGYWDFLKDGRWSLRRHIILRRLAGRDRFKIRRDPLLSAAHRGGEVYGDEYARALSGASIGLGLLRTICPDQHTTRTFEIPACGSMLLADRTEEHQSFFEEGREAEFFSSEEELSEKLQFYTRRERDRARMAERGRERTRRSRYAYIHRLEDVLRALAHQGLGPKAVLPASTNTGRRSAV